MAVTEKKVPGGQQESKIKLNVSTLLFRSSKENHEQAYKRDLSGSMLSMKNGAELF